jgi:ABC-type multidrug transport system ATPase subunit
MSTILSRDFRGYLLENVISFISKQAKQYSKDVFDTDKLDFLLDGNNISIIYDGKDYDVLSGGEKQKVDVIIQLAIRDMLCAFLDFSSNILVLDEITDNLDIVGCQKMFNLISTKLNDVEAVYLISHHQNDFEIPYDDEITIIKGADRISRIYAA